MDIRALEVITVSSLVICVHMKSVIGANILNKVFWMALV